MECFTSYRSIDSEDNCCLYAGTKILVYKQLMYSSITFPVLAEYLGSLQPNQTRQDQTLLQGFP